MKRAFVCALLAGSLLGTNAAQAAPFQASTFVAVHDEAKAALAQGDRALRLAREQDAERHWAEAFDSWRSALELSNTGDLVPLLVQDEEDELWADADGSFQQRNEGVAVAVLRRLSLLEEAGYQRWSIRFSELAAKRLDVARSIRPLLARVERDFPATHAAAIASLRIADLELETGAVQTAKVWLDRGRFHLRLAGGPPELSSSFERRNVLIRALEPAQVSEPWRTATSLRLEREINLHTR